MIVTGLAASPRKEGNSALLVRTALEGAAARGAETRLYSLNDLSIRGCQACYSCKTTGRCGVRDDMQKIYRAIDESDALIIGSPIYFGRIPAQLSLAMDRLFAYLKPDFSSSLAPGKKYTLIFTYTHPDYYLHLDCIHSLGQILEWLGFQPGCQPFVGAGLDGQDAARNNRQYLQAAFGMGKALAGK